MSRGRIEANWTPIADLLALTFNLNRDPKKVPPAKPEQFGPPRKLFRVAKPKPMPGSITDLKIFLPKKHAK